MVLNIPGIRVGIGIEMEFKPLNILLYVELIYSSLPFNKDAGHWSVNVFIY